MFFLLILVKQNLLNLLKNILSKSGHHINKTGLTNQPETFLSRQSQEQNTLKIV